MVVGAPGLALLQFAVREWPTPMHTVSEMEVLNFHNFFQMVWASLHLSTKQLGHRCLNWVIWPLWEVRNIIIVVEITTSTMVLLKFTEAAVASISTAIWQTAPSKLITTMSITTLYTDRDLNSSDQDAINGMIANNHSREERQS
jgi:hypothetical protein